MTAPVMTLPVMSELTGNTLVCVGRTPKGQRTHWTAIWRTPRGNFIHQVTPFDTARDDRQAAIDFVLECPQSWVAK